MFYTWVHALIFCAIGAVAAKLLALAGRELDVGFGILLLFVIFEFGFVAAAMIFAEPILRAVALPAVLVLHPGFDKTGDPLRERVTVRRKAVLGLASDLPAAALAMRLSAAGITQPHHFPALALSPNGVIGRANNEKCENY